MTVAALAVTPHHHRSSAASFAETAETYLTPVHRYLTQLVRNPDLAEDLTAETFERAFRHWHQFDPSRGGALAWLITIARRVAIDHLRAHSRRVDREQRYVAMVPTTVAPQEDDGALSHEMSTALARLSDGERELIALRVLLDVDGPTTAGILGISVSACSTNLHRAMVKLRTELER